MPLDAYSFCPGGTGKKIKFCCPDFIGELQKISRMLEGQQNQGCLQHIEHLERQHPDRACLLAIKTMLLRATGRQDQLADTVARFIEKHPDNPIALVESSIQLATDQKGFEAVDNLQRALVAGQDTLDRRVYDAIGIVAGILLNNGEWSAGRALLQLQMVIGQDDERPVQMLVEMNRSPHVPLLSKDDPPMAVCPEDAPYKTQFEEAMAPTKKGNWQEAAEMLTALAGQVDDSPAIWRNLVTLRGWLADRNGCAEALRKLASLEIPPEDAAEAEATAMLCSDDPLGDPLQMINLLWEIKDVERVDAALSLESRTQQIPFDPASFGDEENPPPKSAYLLLDRPIGEPDEKLTWQSVSQVLGQMMIYGRQTGREARLEMIGVASEDIQQVQALLKEITGDALDADVKQEVMAEVSASQELLHDKWRPPSGLTPQQLQELTADYRRHALLSQWPELKLAVFDGKSAREVVQDESYRVKLAAAVMVLECWIEGMPGTFDFNELRTELGLPELEPIDPDEVPIDTVPLVRLWRVMVEKLSDEDLVRGFQRTAAFRVTTALRKFARVLVDRPGLAGSDGQLQAYRYLSQTAEDLDSALDYIEQGRQATISANQSCASWDLMELPLRMARQESDELSRLIDHLQSQHVEEPGVGEALMQLLVQAGVIRPDGTPMAPPQQQAGPMDDPLQAAAAPQAAAEAEPGKIWTPGDESSGGEKKLWTPD